MCIILTAHEPKSTRLVNIPVKVDDNNYKLLLYTNDLPIEIDESGSNNAAIMIVPIPNAKNVDNFGLVDVSTNSMKEFRQKLFAECDMLVPDMLGFTDSFEISRSFKPNSKKKKIHDVGNYKISIANNLDELYNNIEWNKYKLPSNFKMRFNTLKNTNIYNDKQYAYVVAQAQKSIKDDGFGIVYPDCEYDYFPTAHEQINDSDNIVDHDFKIYNFSNDKKNIISFDKMIKQQKFINGLVRYINSDITCYHLVDKSILMQLNLLLNKQMIMSKNGEKKEYNFVINDLICNFAEFDGYYSNSNLII